MADRKAFVGGNWKMNLHRVEAVQLAEALSGVGSEVDVAIYPAFPYLDAVGAALAEAGSKVLLGAQDFYDQPEGAFTGEVSLGMLSDLGVKTVLVGHSERRHVIGETDEKLNQKVRAALAAGCHVVLCVGETLEQREQDRTDGVNAGQVCLGLAGVSKEQLSQVVIAYEPVWAIGTGKTATPGDAQSAHKAIRSVLAQQFDASAAEAMRIIYGGSVKPGNAAELFGQPDIDGGLIGGASLKADDFSAIVKAAG